MIRLVIFDCDGVMFDTAEVNRAYYNRILRRFGHEDMTPEQFRYVHQHTVDESISFLFEEPAAVAAAHHFRREMTYEPFIGLMRPEPHLESLLNWLRPKYGTAIVTNRTDTMNRVLDTFRLASFFDVVITAWDVERPKPHPEGLLKALSHFGMPPSEALYVGDSSVDAGAAEAAGVPFAAFANPELPARFHINGLNEIPALLTNEDAKGVSASSSAARHSG